MQRTLPMKIINNLESKLDKARWTTLISYALLITTLTTNSVIRSQPLVILLATVIPLLIFVPGLFKEHYKSLSLLCFVTLLYFIVAISNVFANNRTWMDIVEVVLIVILFNACMLFSRWKQYSLYQDTGAENSEK